MTTTETTTPATTAASTPAPRPRGLTPLRIRLLRRNGSRLLTGLVAVWVILVSFGAQLGAWLAAALSTDPGGATPWIVASGIQVVLAGPPVLIMAWRWPHPRYRSIFAAWAWAVGYVLWLAPTRLLTPVWSQPLLACQTLLTVVYWLIVRRRAAGIAGSRLPEPAGGPGLALSVSALLAWPWLQQGAFGSALDVLLALAAGAAFGYLAWSILLTNWIPAQRRDPRRPRQDRATGGFVAGVTVLILASAYSFNGAQLLLMLVLPAAAWAALATGVPGRAYAVIAATVLALVDTDGLHLALLDPLLLAYLAAAAWAVLMAWLLAAASLAREAGPAGHFSYFGALIPGLVLAGIVLAAMAHPGYHGDRLFVTLKDQADVASASDLPDLTERRTAVYTALTAHAQTTQSDLRAALGRMGIASTSYYLVNGLEVEAGAPVWLWLRTRQEVARIMPSPRLRPTDLSVPDVGSGDQVLPAQPWNLHLIGADRVHAELGIDGTGVVVGQSDSGVAAGHAEVAAAYRGAGSGNDYNWFDPWFGSEAPVDESGHGTHTLGTVLGKKAGVAPGATWFGCANLARGLGNPALYLDCMQFMLAPFPLDGDPFVDGDPAQAADVLNNSWGCPEELEGCDPAAYLPAVAALKAAGIFVVASAGNEGPACATVAAPLAIYDDVFSVGAVDERGDLAAFSSAGPVTVDGSGRIKPDVLAPGVDVISAWPNGGYETASGTSMAGPHVAGVVALMWSANPSLKGNVPATTAILAETAQPFGGDPGILALPEALDDVPAASNLLTAMESATGRTACLDEVILGDRPNVVAGYGVVDAYAAVQAALAWQPVANQ